tara:strand:+ start:455886 stop:457121 length:1236 start_codon:yes stop_codon:yes gene_type:complete
MSQARYAMAEQEIRRVLADQPDLAAAHAMLGACIVSTQTRLDEATKEAETAVHLEPDNPYNHFVLSFALAARNRFDESLAAIRESIRLDPYDADYFGQQARVCLSMRNWQQALDSAEAGLAIDPEDTHCNNVRSIALERLGRSDDAIESAARNLQNDPDDSYSHSAYGWVLLNAGRHGEAQTAFRESLRLDANNDAAREGMIHAINSRSIVFRFVRSFHVALSRLSTKYQFAIILGAWLMIQALQELGNLIPLLVPLIPLLLMAYMAFAVLTWTSNAVFNTFLRFHPFGRHLLNPTQIWTSNLVAACMISGVVGTLYTGTTLGLLGAIVVAYYWMLMCVPATVPFSMATPARAIGIGVAGLAIGLIPVYGVLNGSSTDSVMPIVKSMTTFNWGIIGLQVAAGILSVAPNRQ